MFILAVAAACTLAGAKNVLRDLGGKRHLLKREITAPSETRIRTLLHLIDTEILDQVIGGWLRDLADQGKLDGLLTAIAIDGKWLCGVLDGQVKLFSAMLHEEKVIIAQHRIPDDTTETTQVRALLEHVDLDNAVVTADAANAQKKTAKYIAGQKEDGGRGSAYFLFVKGNQKNLQRAVFDAVQDGCPRDPDHSELDKSQGPIIRRSIWVTDSENIDFPHVRQVAGSAATVTPPNAGYAGNAGRPWPRYGISASACSIFPASPRSPAPSRPSDMTETESSTTCRYETQVSNDFGDPVDFRWARFY